MQAPRVFVIQARFAPDKNFPQRPFIFIDLLSVLMDIILHKLQLLIEYYYQIEDFHTQDTRMIIFRLIMK